MMDELFSCRNCIHNCAQSLHIGRGPGFCLQHNSVIWDSNKTTCKYLHRKDLPVFVVDEGIREHAAEFAGFSGMADLKTHKAIKLISYSERFVWEKRLYDPLLHAIAQYHKSSPAWVFIQAFSGGLDGRRSLAHAAFVRRFMNHCGTWKSSYRLVLGLLQEIDEEPGFDERSVIEDEGLSEGEIQSQALWDVIFTRIAGLQEYGWHAGLKELMWATDTLDGALTDLNWKSLHVELARKRESWTRLAIKHAEKEGVFFPAGDPEDVPEVS